MGRFYFWILLSCLVCFSTQQNIRLTQSSSNPSEGDLLTLRCVAASGYNLLQWSLNGKIVVESTTTNYTLAYGKNESQYAVSVTTNKVGKHILRMDIKPVSRNDTGRWECLVSSTSGSPESAESRTSVTVNYFPDPEYPACEITASQRASCSTQQGRPLVVLRWIEESQGSVDIIPERDSSSGTRNSIVFSELEPSVLRPPKGNNDSISCEIEQNLKNRQCSILKQDIYALAYLNISQVNGKRTASCSVEPSYFRSFLQLSWEHAEDVQGNVSNTGDNSKKVTFGEVTPNLDGNKVICTLIWGVMDYKNVSLPLVVNALPTTLVHFPTVPPSRMSSSKPTTRPFLDDMTTKRSIDKNDNVKTVEPEPSDVIKVTTKRDSRDLVTLTTRTEPMFTFTDCTTELDNEFVKSESEKNILAILLFALILFAILLLLCIVCICVLCKRKKRATATVV